MAGTASLFVLGSGVSRVDTVGVASVSESDCLSSGDSDPDRSTMASSGFCSETGAGFGGSGMAKNFASSEVGLVHKICDIQDNSNFTF